MTFSMIHPTMATTRALFFSTLVKSHKYCSPAPEFVTKTCQY